MPQFTKIPRLSAIEREMLAALTARQQLTGSKVDAPQRQIPASVPAPMPMSWPNSTSNSGNLPESKTCGPL